jgi:hypothetical protein
LVAITLIGCGAEQDESSHDEYGESELPAGVSKPIRIRSGVWWGDVATPNNNQLWVDCRDCTPGVNVTSKLTLTWSCELPKLSGATQTLGSLTSQGGATESGVGFDRFSATAGQLYSRTLDFTNAAPGWYEARIRCQAKETTGVDAGNTIFSTVAFPIQVKGGTSTHSGHGNPGAGTHNHAWYDEDVGYVYNGFKAVPPLVDAPLKGSVTIPLSASATGDAAMHHWRILADDVVLKEIFGGSTGGTTSYVLDTTKLSNGSHKLQFHSHALSTGYRAGQQLASQVELFVQVQN